ncbi:MAG TPA: PIN domain-containing protein [Thermoplasmata archaeon]|nr:PIN domain-containing protein [Thermoplasmata archaeon]
MVSLDSTFVIDLLKRRASAVEMAAAFDREGTQVSISPPAGVEVLSGGQRLGGAYLQRVRDLLASLPLLPFDQDAIDTIAHIAADLMSRGERLSEGDLFIAGISMRHGEEVVTRDRAFGRVRGLSVRFYE